MTLPAKPAWAWEPGERRWALPYLPALDVGIFVEREGPPGVDPEDPATAWAVVLRSATGTERDRFALALGGLVEHQALARVLWRRLVVRVRS